MAEPVIDILMYHSISDRGGATAIAADTFARQMQVLAQSGVPVVTLDDLVAGRIAAPRAAIITFDDGFQDFADTAWPILESHGFPAMVYLPTNYIGRTEGWRGIAMPPRPLMDWTTIRDLAGRGALFGSHTLSHPSLTVLDDAALARELVESRRIIEDALGTAVQHVAPPYGLADGRVRKAIGAAGYRTSVSTRLASAGLGADPLNLPRLEMFYFADPRRWSTHLAGRGGGYLLGRRVLRGVKARLMAPWSGL